MKRIRTQTPWTIFRTIGTLVLALAVVVFLAGQFQWELELITRFDQDFNPWHRALGWMTGCALIAICLWQIGLTIPLWLDETFPNPQRLFRDLCELHQLQPAESTLIQQRATGLNLADPCQLFVDESCWKSDQQETQTLFSKLFRPPSETDSPT